MVRSDAPDFERIRNNVYAELSAMKRVGMRVPQSALDSVATFDFSDCWTARTSELADLVIALTDMRS